MEVVGLPPAAAVPFTGYFGYKASEDRRTAETVVGLEEAMRKQDFIGTLISEDKVAEVEGIEIDWAEDEEGNSAMEVFLSEFPYDGWPDKAGFNAYSIRLVAPEGRITSVLRIGHVHMKGGEGYDEELPVFPLRSLEREAQKVMEYLTLLLKAED
jgi:hypothetical protein